MLLFNSQTPRKRFAELTSKQALRKIAGTLAYVLSVLVGVYLLLIAVGVAVPSINLAALNPWAVHGPRLSFEPRAVDFGSMNQLASGRQTIALRNSGDETVKLGMVRASSAALTLGTGRREIAPGSKVDLSLDLKPVGLSGTQKFTVSFVTNESRNKQKHVSVKAIVDHSISRRPGLRMEQLIFDADCRGCHLEPGLGKTGNALFAAVCAACHGPRGRGKQGQPGARLTADRLRTVIISGRSGTAMPAWGRQAGGYLSREQVDSLVKVMLDWRKAEATR